MLLAAHRVFLGCLKRFFQALVTLEDVGPSSPDESFCQGIRSSLGDDRRPVKERQGLVQIAVISHCLCTKFEGIDRIYCCLIWVLGKPSA